MRPSQSTSMANSFLSHGLAGIDVHHVETRRNQEIAGNQTAQALSRPSAGPIRQRIGSLMIAIGDRLLGRPPAQPRTARFV